MQVKQFQYKPKDQWRPSVPQRDEKAQLVLIFGETHLLKLNDLLSEMKERFPSALLFGCSTAGEIYKDHVFDDTVCISVISFKSTRLELSFSRLSEAEGSFQIGSQLAKKITHDHLKHVLVLSAGLNINGSELTKGISSALPKDTTISGGLAGDQDRFTETLVIADKAIGSDVVALLGFYGDEISVGMASMGGWDPFGPQRLITKSTENILYELDGKSALQIYKQYLGEHAKDLPGSALLFPLSLKLKDSREGLVRTILAVDEEQQSMIFAGDVPTGSYVQLMKANFDRVIDGATGAAQKSINSSVLKNPELAILISCVGRKIILKQRIDEEIEGVRNVFGERTFMTGFYSYGEICPLVGGARCELHNQTMTVTTLSEMKKDAA